MKNQEILVKKSGLEEPYQDFAEVDVAIKEEIEEMDLEPDFESDPEPKPIRKGKNVRKRKKAAAGVKFATCELCSAVLRAENMREHMQGVHEGIRRFTCDMCGKGLNRKNKLAAHLKVN